MHSARRRGVGGPRPHCREAAATGRLSLYGWVIDAKPLSIRGLMPTVRLDKGALTFGLKPLLDSADLQIRRGERVCLLGRNGEGKSSLLQLITRQIAPDGGEVWVRPGARVASLVQEGSGASEATMREVVMSGFDLRADAHSDWQDELQADQVIARLQLDRDAAM